MLNPCSQYLQFIFVATRRAIAFELLIWSERNERALPTYKWTWKTCTSKFEQEYMSIGNDEVPSLPDVFFFSGGIVASTLPGLPRENV